MTPKFRAYDSGSLSRMYQPDEVMVGNGDIWIIDEDSAAGEWIVNNDIHLMQSTGLKDDLDKEIFEGDVILWTYWDEFEDSGRAKIIFDKGMFKLLDIHTEKEVWDSLSDCIENCNVFLQGNIYENPELPELLEEKE